MDANAFFRQPGAELRAQLRVGRVSSSNASKHTAQVEFFEQDGFISHDLQIMFSRPGDYSVYEKDTLVLCAILDGIQGFGWVLGALYSENSEIATDAPPLNDKDARAIASDDLRLGDPAADKYVALANLVKDRLDRIQDKFDHHTHIITVTSVDGDTATAALPASPIGTLDAVAAEKVKAK